MKKRIRHSMLVNLGIIFLIFTLVTLSITSVLTYMYQSRSELTRQKDRLQNVATYMSDILSDKAEDFVTYQRFFMEHYEEMRIPADFTADDMAATRAKFVHMFNETYPGRVMGIDVKLEEMPMTIQLAYAEFRHEYYCLIFEAARDTFGLQYVYYFIPDEETNTICYMFNPTREVGQPIDESCLLLGKSQYQDPSEHPNMWQAWLSGEKSGECDVFRNDFDNTYAWFTPVYCEGIKLGVIGTEITISSFNQLFFTNVLHQILVTALVLILAVIIILIVLNDAYVERIKNLANDIDNYSVNKDACIAQRIEKETSGKDEIAELGKHTAAMILELENYMKRIIDIQTQLTLSEEHANAMAELAHKDALTGALNRNAYETEVQRLDWHIADNKTRFGIVMADVNHLKKINDTYGHERGNRAIKNVCYLLRGTFTTSTVYRIGGDEFVVLVEGDDYDAIEERIASFNEHIEELQEKPGLNEWDRTSASIGYALYEPNNDESVEQVFKRADIAMYARKVAMKAQRK